MKKLTTLFCAILLATTFASAGSWWQGSFITVTSNATLYNHAIWAYAPPTNWTNDGNWQTNTAFDGHDFGTVSSLILNGGYGEGGTYDADDFMDAASYVIYYRAYSTTGTPGAYSSIPLTNLFYTSGTRGVGATVAVIYNNVGAAVDVKALVGNLAGTYYLEVIMTQTVYWQTTASPWTTANAKAGSTTFVLNNASTGYKATFTISNTSGVNEQTDSKVRITSQSGVINAIFDGENRVELYTMSGQLISSVKVANQFTQSVKKGVYMILINGKAHKVIVQ